MVPLDSLEDSTRLVPDELVLSSLEKIGSLFLGRDAAGLGRIAARCPSSTQAFLRALAHLEAIGESIRQQAY